MCNAAVHCGPWLEMDGCRFGTSGLRVRFLGQNWTLSGTSVAGRSRGWKMICRQGCTRSPDFKIDREGGATPVCFLVVCPARLAERVAGINPLGRKTFGRASGGIEPAAKKVMHTPCG